MPTSFVHYAVDASRPGATQRFLVRRSDLPGICRAGYEEVALVGVAAHLEAACERDRLRLCDFVLRAGLTRASLTTLDSRGLARVLRGALAAHELAVVRVSTAKADAKDDELRDRRRIVAAIEKAVGRPRLNHEGRSYRLLADRDLAAMPNRNSYEVVSRKDALAVLEGLGRNAEPRLAGFFAEARDKLSQDWRAPLSPNGLVLLRAVVQRVDAEAPADSAGWRPGRPKKSMFDPLAAAAPEAPEVDQASQADTLIRASQEGVPFCEECARRKASRAADGP